MVRSPNGYLSKMAAWPKAPRFTTIHSPNQAAWK